MALYTKLRHIMCNATVNVVVRKPPIHTNIRRISFLICEDTKSDLSRTKTATHCCGFHTTPYVFKRRKTFEEKKSTRKIIEYPPKAKGEVVGVWKDITLKELANVLNADLNYVQDIFLNQIKDVNTPISDVKHLNEAIRRSGHRMEIIGKPTNEIQEIVAKDVFPRPPAKKSELRPRPPVVTVMGHVDHGKTTLLDSLRHSRIVDQEFGGITQHIGAFSVVLDSGARVTFLDTPGHAAFTAMRTRGASLTDIIVLVVAADDGVMEQTLESIRMARKAEVPILVAINKIDSPKADIDRTERMLVEAGIQVENLGGDVQAVPISALKKLNLDKLTEALVLQAEMLEIGADPSGPVEAIVVESKVHQYRGKLATIVVKRGTLKKGDILVAGTAFAKVKALQDAEGNVMKTVPPGFPAEVAGWRDMPSAGDLVLQVVSEQRARQVIDVREKLKTKEKQEQDAVVIAAKRAEHDKVYKENLAKKRRLGLYKMRPEGPRQPEVPKEDNVFPKLKLVVKADVDGSMEALLDILVTYDGDDICKMDVIHYGVGAVSENDIQMAKASNGVVYAFNVDCLPKIAELAEADKVVIKRHNVIYKLIDDIKEEINARLPPIEVEDVIGEAKVLQMFEATPAKGQKKVPVAGSRCTKGVLKKSAKFKLIRDGEVLFTGNLSSMRHMKDEVDTIKNGVECGLMLPDSSISFKPEDTFVCFQMKPLPQSTKWDPGF